MKRKFKFTSQLFRRSILALSWTILVVATMTHANTISVTSTADSGPGTLRQALASASDGDTIDATGVSGTILLTSGELLVANSVAIVGPGAGALAVDGAASNRVFHIQYGTVTISGLTIAHGATGLGGGIFNEYGTLTVSNCTISANSAQGRGGGIENYGSLTIAKSTISGNVAGSEGGAIDNIGLGVGIVRINNSTISGNQAGIAGGGIAHYANGSSVYLTVFNCTFSDNIVTNGSGDDIWMYGQSGLGSASMEIGSTILKVAPSRTSLYTQGNQVSVQSDGYNLCSDSAGYYLFSTGDQLNTDPLLGPLEDNGGPTFTQALLTGSPAIDRGKNFSGSSYDQRGAGFVRTYDDPSILNAPGGDGTDVGALEAEPCSTIVTTTADSGPGSLRGALQCAIDGDTIDATSISGTILLTSGELLVTKNVTIAGPGPDKLAVDGKAAGRVFHISPNKVVNLCGLTVTNGTFGGLYPEGGGGIYNDHATLMVSNCWVRRNSTTSQGLGGGIANDGYSGSAALTLTHSTVSDNFAGSGGGIYNGGNYGTATVIVVNCTINSNSAPANFYDDGGGIFSDGFSGNVILTITNSVLNGNSAADGGAILSRSEISGHATLTIASSVLSGNTSSFFGGGAIDNYGDVPTSVQIIDSTLSGNTAKGNGGGLYNVGDGNTATITILNSTLSANTATDYGGAIFNYGSTGIAAAVIANSTFSGNSAWQGGGAYNECDGSTNVDISVINSTFSDNSAPGGGGAIFNNLASNNGSSTARVELASTILKAGTSGGTLTNIQGTILSHGYNLSSDNGGGVLNQPTDLINTDPKLGPLQDNGGPTFTHALLLGSPAIDKGTNFAASATDQRGQTRTYDNPGIPNAAGGDGTDIGAFEFIPPTLGIAPDYGDVILSWSTNDPGYTVESTTALGNAATWTPVPGTPLIIGDQYLLGDGPVAGSKFYRLRTP